MNEPTTTRRISVVSRRVERIAWEVPDALSPEDAADRYLGDGDEVGSMTESHEVVELDGQPQAPTSYPVTASLDMGDYGEPFASVTVGPAQITTHSSTVDANTVNIELDGVFTGDPDHLRVHLNDRVVYDSRLPLTNRFDADELEAALCILAELYTNADDDTGNYLSTAQQALAARVLDVGIAVVSLQEGMSE